MLSPQVFDKDMTSIRPSIHPYVYTRTCTNTCTYTTPPAGTIWSYAYVCTMAMEWICTTGLPPSLIAGRGREKKKKVSIEKGKEKEKEERKRGGKTKKSKNLTFPAPPRDVIIIISINRFAPFFLPKQIKNGRLPLMI